MLLVLSMLQVMFIINLTFTLLQVQTDD